MARMHHRQYAVDDALLERDGKGNIALSTEHGGYLLELPISNPPEFREVTEGSKYITQPFFAEGIDLLMLGVRAQFARVMLIQKFDVEFDMHITEIQSDEQKGWVVFFTRSQ